MLPVELTFYNVYERLTINKFYKRLHNKIESVARFIGFQSQLCHLLAVVFYLGQNFIPLCLTFLLSKMRIIIVPTLELM